MVEGAKRGGPWRVAGWGIAALLLIAPFLAMHFTSDVKWTASDFVVAGSLFALVGGVFELAIRQSPNWAYRSGAGLGLLATFLTIWSNLAVGIVGSEDKPANRLFFAALLIGIGGACAARFKAPGMARAMTAQAAALGIAFAIAVAGQSGEPFVGHWVELAGTAVFAALFLGSAALFRKASSSSQLP